MTKNIRKIRINLLHNSQLCVIIYLSIKLYTFLSKQKNIEIVWGYVSIALFTMLLYSHLCELKSMQLRNFIDKIIDTF